MGSYLSVPSLFSTRQFYTYHTSWAFNPSTLLFLSPYSRILNHVILLDLTSYHIMSLHHTSYNYTSYTSRAVYPCRYGREGARQDLLRHGGTDGSGTPSLRTSSESTSIGPSQKSSPCYPTRLWRYVRMQV